MFILHSYAPAVALCVVTMLCWGSWANTQKLAGRHWRFELFYWDYALGVLLLSLAFAFTLGSLGSEGRPFLDDLAQADRSNIMSAMLGGLVFNVANILLVAAIDLAGMAVAFPVGIGLALVIGVVQSYAVNPVGNAAVLFTGVAVVALAIILDALAYRRLGGGAGGGKVKGILLSVICGVMMGFFYPLVAGAMVTDFAAPQAGLLTPYSAVVLFALGLFLSNFILNTLVMRFPFRGEPVSMGEYFKGSLGVHLTGVLGGAIWCVGMSFSIIASGMAGPAISYGLGQGATLVAALWGVFVWKEFAAAPKGTNKLLAGMFLLFVIGLGLIIYARTAGAA